MSANSTRPERSRRTTRGEHTRKTLLDATYRCLVELGYARTSTAEVCRRTETARGTLLHHFATKEELVLAAMDHVLRRRLKQFRRAIKRNAARGPAAAVGELWKIIKGPTFFAWLELAVAARTDPRLRAPFKRLMLDFHDQADSISRELWPASGAVDPRHVATFALSTLNGLAIETIYRRPDAVQPVLELFQGLAAAADPARDDDA